MKKNKALPLIMAVLASVIAAGCTSSASESEEKTLFIAPATADCVGVGPQQCMLVREDPEEDWSFFYGQIEGFEYEEGFLFEIIVSVEEVEDPPADASSLKYSLVEVVNKTPVALKTVIIGPERVACEGEGPQSCYQYKENPEDEWLLYYGEIQGFEYEEGFEYELLVAETNIDDPPAGGSSTQLTLVQQLDKSESTASVIGTVWALTSLYEQPVMEGVTVTMEISDERIGGFAGCNTYFGPFAVEGNQLEIGTLGATKKACLDPNVSGQEFTFLDGLQTATTYEFVTESELALSDDKGQIMTFEKIEPAPLEGTLWELMTYNNGNNALISVVEGSRITALFEEGTVGGSAGCNNYSGGYELEGNKIEMGPFAVNMMMCPDPGVMEQEAKYLAALESAAEYKIVANKLELVNREGATAAIYNAAEPVSLEDHQWEVLRYNNGNEGVVSVIIGSRITANFDGEQVSGVSGCNNYFGGYQDDGENIDIGPLANTEKACMDPEGVMAQEQLYLAALQSAATYRIDGEILDMWTEDGARAVTMRAAEEVGLENKVWAVTNYNNGRGGFTSIIAGTELSMLFEEGTLSGSAGCNNYNASYELEGSTVQISPAAATRKLCSEPEGIMEQESEFLAALETASEYKIDGDRVEMRTAEGSLAIGGQLEVE